MSDVEIKVKAQVTADTSDLEEKAKTIGGGRGGTGPGSVRAPAANPAGAAAQQQQSQAALKTFSQHARELVTQSQRTRSAFERAAGAGITKYQAREIDADWARRAKVNPLMQRVGSFSGMFDPQATRYFGSEAQRQNFIQAQTREAARVAGLSAPGQPGGAAGAGTFKRFAGAAGGMLAGAATGGGMGAGAALGGLAGMIPGVGMLLGPLVGGIAGKIEASMDKAKAEGLDASKLKAAIGDTTASFETVRDATRNAARGIVDYNEAIKLTTAFVRQAGLRGDGAKDVDREMRGAYGFARSYGLENSQSADFFSKMRLSRASEGDKDSRRIGVSVAEAIERGGLTAKTDELISAIGNFATTSARQSLAKPNVEGFAGMMGAAGKLKIPGLDVQNAASIFSRADQTTRRGGGMGEKSMLFQYQNIAPKFEGMNLYDLDTLNNKGLLGTARQAFGKESVAHKYAESRGDKKEMARLEGMSNAPAADLSNFELRMEGYEKRFGHNTNQMVDVMRNDLLGPGATYDEARALAMMHGQSGEFGKMKDYLAGLNLKPENIKPSSLGGIASVFAGDRKMADTYADKLLKGDEFSSLSREESAKLAGLRKGGDTEALKAEVVKLLSSRERMTDDGQKAADAQIRLNQKFQEYAGAIVPITASIKDGVAAIAEKIAPDSDFARAGAVIRQTSTADLEAKVAAGDKQLAGLDDKIAAADKKAASLPEGSIGRWGAERELNRLREEKDRGQRYLGMMKNAVAERKLGATTSGASAAAEAAPESPADDRIPLANHASADDRRDPRDFAAARPGETTEAKGAGESIRKQPSLVTPEQAEAMGAVRPRSPLISSGRVAAMDKKTARRAKLAEMVAAPSQYDDEFKRAAKDHGVDWRDLKQLAAQESGLDANAVNRNKNGTVDRGLMQLNSRYDKARGVTDAFDPKQNIEGGAKAWAEALKAAKGDKAEAFRRYNGSGEQAERYAAASMRLNDEVRARVPDSGGVKVAASGKGEGKQTVRVELYQNGKEAAAPVEVAVPAYWPPMPAGGRA